MTKDEKIELFKGYAQKFDRNTDTLMEWLLNESDFFTAPASTIYHSNWEGGLFEHVRNVMNFALGINSFMKQSWNREPNKISSVMICSLLHDVCKCNVYQKEKRFTKIDGRWATYEGYKYVENLPFGHGEKSLYILGKLIKLEDDEAAAIMYHMGFFIQQAHIPFPFGMAQNEAMGKYPLVRLIQQADACTGMVEISIDYKAKAMIQ